MPAVACRLGRFSRIRRRPPTDRPRPGAARCSAARIPGRQTADAPAPGVRAGPARIATLSARPPGRLRQAFELAQRVLRLFRAAEKEALEAEQRLGDAPARMELAHQVLG